MTIFFTYPIILCLALFASMLIGLEYGRRLGKRRVLAEGSSGNDTGAIDSAVFGLFGLIVAFTFYGAAARFDERRHLIVEEANAIGTAYLRTDLAPPALQPQLKDAFRRYVDSRLVVYRRVDDAGTYKASLERSAKIQNEIWSLAVAAGSRADSQPSANILLLPAVNQMIDITTTRAMAIRTHPPSVIFVMLVGLALASSLLAGYSMANSATRNWLHIICFAGVTTFSICIIVDYEYPRLGLIQVTDFDQLLGDVRGSMD